MHHFELKELLSKPDFTQPRQSTDLRRNPPRNAYYLAPWPRHRDEGAVAMVSPEQKCTLEILCINAFE